MVVTEPEAAAMLELERIVGPQQSHQHERAACNAEVKRLLTTTGRAMLPPHRETADGTWK